MDKSLYSTSKRKLVNYKQYRRWILPLTFICLVFWFLHRAPVKMTEDTPIEDLSKEDIKALSDFLVNHQLKKQAVKRENAAFVILARNDDRKGIREAIQQLEDRFNHKYNYPYVFLNDEPFDNNFIEYTSALASGETHYGLVNEAMWSYPDWINQDKAAKVREDMAEKDIPYGDSESYRHMCRFQSGFFFRHPLLAGYDYYWRVEPDVRFSCDIDYDPFKIMRERDLKYGFTISLREYEETIPSLWETTKEFIATYPEYVVPFNHSESLIKFVSDDKGRTYNLCHFWSNFEIGSLKFLNSKEYLAYFNFLDRAGGFFYERWGDAPVHSIAAAILLRSSEVHYFYDIGYFHDPFLHCPSEPAWLPKEKCSCDPSETIEQDQEYSCHSNFLSAAKKRATDYIITTRDPRLN